LKIFVRFRNETHWKFEVIYQFEGINSSSFEVQLPIGNCLDLFVEIRDYLDGITRFNLSSITVTKEAFSGLLSSNLNQNEISQTISLITEEFNEKESQTIDKAISNGIPLTTISVSSLFSQVNLLVSNFSKKSTNKPIVVKISSNLSHLFN